MENLKLKITVKGGNYSPCGLADSSSLDYTLELTRVQLASLIFKATILLENQRICNGIKN